MESVAVNATERPDPRDPWATDTADPARIFREMFPSPAPLIDWRLFMSGEDLVRRGIVRPVPRRRVL